MTGMYETGDVDVDVDVDVDGWCVRICLCMLLNAVFAILHSGVGLNMP